MPLPILSIAAQLFNLDSKLISIFRTYPGALITFLPTIIFGKLLSKNLHRRTTASNNAGHVIHDTVWFCYFVIGFYIIQIIFALGSII